MLVIHKDKAEAFKKLIQQGKLSHAYLFFGDSGVGKFSFAKTLANFLELEKFEEGVMPLIDSRVFSSPAGREGKTIGIDLTRELKRFLSSKPLKSKKSLAILNEAEKLTPVAQSALLKIVEEPPAHAVIILITHLPQALFSPLLSRLTKVYFPRLKRNEIEKILREKFNIAEIKAKKISFESFGSLSRAMMLEGIGQKVEEDEISKKIIDLYLKDPRRNANLLSWLLGKESVLKRFNLNPNLQKKAIDAMINLESRVL